MVESDNPAADSQIRQRFVWPEPNKMETLFRLMVAAALSLVTGCVRSHKVDRPLTKESGTLSEQAQIRIVVSEVAIREVVSQPSATPVFLDLDEQELRTLTGRLSNFLVSVTNKAEFVRGRGYREIDSGMFGVFMSLREAEVSGSNATMRVGYSFGSPVGVNGRFEFDLVRDDGWTITRTNHTRIIR